MLPEDNAQSNADHKRRKGSLRKTASGNAAHAATELKRGREINRSRGMVCAGITFVKKQLGTAD